MRTATVVALALLCGGCAKLVYNRIDTLAGWFISSLVTLEPEQRDDMRAWLSSTHDWHRSSELGRYAAFLRDLADRVATPGARPEYEDTAMQIEAFVQAVVAQASPEAAQLLMRLSPSQLAELDANLERRARERAEESLRLIEKGDWRKRRAREMRKELKRWTGRVSAEQKEIIEDAAAMFEPTSAEWLESQRRWRAALIAVLSAPRGSHTETEVLRLLQHPEALWSEGYRALSERNRAHSMALLEQLDHALTPEQRERMRRELHKAAAQLDSLRASVN